MTVSDMWTRSYELFTTGFITRHIYTWHHDPGGDMPMLRVGPRHNDHPPWTYAPPRSKSVRQIGYTIYTLTDGSEAIGTAFARVLSPPTANTDTEDSPYWDYSGLAVEEVWLVVNCPDMFRGTMVDDNGIPLVWEFGGADFSTPFPSWVFQDMPTHFRLVNHGTYGRALIQPLLATHTDLADNSIEIPEPAHVLTKPYGGDTFSFDGVDVGRIRGNGGRLSRRLCPMPGPWSTDFGDFPPELAWDSSTGDLLGADSLIYTQRSMYPTDTTYDVELYASPFLLFRHRETKPTIRYRCWTTLEDGYTADGYWQVRHVGLYGTQTEDIAFSGTVVATGTGYKLIRYDVTFDLNDLVVPPGTLLSVITGYAMAAYGSDTWLEGPEPVSYCGGGSRSGIGGSVYIPGRVLKLGNIPLDGSTPTAV